MNALALDIAALLILLACLGLILNLSRLDAGPRPPRRRGRPVTGRPGGEQTIERSPFPYDQETYG